MQSHPAAARLREKSFPYLEELTIIFGKDRATKAGAEALANVVEEIDRERPQIQITRWKFVKD